MSLFSSFDKEELCQLYVYPSYPNVSMVNSSYRITDRDAIKAILPQRCVGSQVEAAEYIGDMVDNEIDKRIYSKQSNNSAIKRLLRDAVWSISHWYSDQLMEWLNRESPSCIFLAPGYAKFIYDIALKISKDRNIPLITYVCDDYYFVNKPDSFLGQIQLRLLQKKIRKEMMHSRLSVVISEEIKENYFSEFGVETEVIMTGANINIASFPDIKEQINSFSYFGNVGLNRKHSLKDIGCVLDEINKEHKTNYRLKIFTKYENQELDLYFDGIKSIELQAFLVGEAFTHELLSSDCLVHVEAFDEKSKDIVKGSISTKIADSLASGIPLLAYGPDDIASIEHLKRNNSAFHANSFASLKSVILEVIDDIEQRKLITESALKTAKQFHDSNVNSLKLRAIIKSMQEE